MSLITAKLPLTNQVIIAFPFQIIHGYQVFPVPSLFYPKNSFCRLVPEVPVVPSSSGPSKSRKRCFGRGKKKRRKRLKDAKRRCTERMVGTRARSAESSPGRRTPSPSTLASICQYWEECLASPQYIIQSDSD